MLPTIPITILCELHSVFATYKISTVYCYAIRKFKLYGPAVRDGPTYNTDHICHVAIFVNILQNFTKK